MFPVSDIIPSRTRPVVTIGLIVVNSLAFLYQLQLDRQGMYELAHAHGVIPADFVWRSVLTSLFIHDGWIHFGGNMLYLWIFGDNVEDSMGHAAYALFYFAAAALAALAHTAFSAASTAPLIGASGAVAATMGAYFVLYPRSRVLTAIFLLLYLDLIEIPAIVFLGIWLLMQLLSGLASMGAGAADGGVAFTAHIAGFAVGATVALVLRQRRRLHWE
jgi:membrane associated rhomboid family serine protease